MQTIYQTVQVSYHYAVSFTQHLFAPENPLLRETLGRFKTNGPVKVLCVLDSGVAQAHPDLIKEIIAYTRHAHSEIELVAEPLLVEGGEKTKNDPANVQRVLEGINSMGICRHSFVLAIGGGAVLDMVGYAAATAHRGVALIRVPTTVLSQNDSGVGVKNGINAFGKKNFLGTFAPPIAVINDEYFLTTLSERDWRSGIAEAIKVALLKDTAFFQRLEELAPALVERSMPAMLEVIYRCAQLHLEHIATSGDPFEAGSSRPLDFGHWSAHKLEQLSHYELRHGEAVAIGIAVDSTYAFLLGSLPEKDWQRILKLIHTLGFALSTPELQVVEKAYPLLEGLEEFREHLGGLLTIPLLTSIGSPFEVHEIDHSLMLKSILLLENK